MGGNEFNFLKSLLGDDNEEDLVEEDFNVKFDKEQFFGYISHII